MIRDSWRKTDIHKVEFTVIIVITFVILLAAFFYLDRRDVISDLIRTWGLGGIFIAILLMGILSMTPIPSEGLLLLYIKIYGPYHGIFYAWLGSILGTSAIYMLAHIYGHRLFRSLLASDRVQTVDQWVKRKGSIGLFIARLLPIPAFAVNYIAGVMPSIEFWPYVWTFALSIIPYYLGTAFVYMGVTRAAWMWLIIGSIAIIAFWGTGYLLNKRKIHK